VQVLKNVCLFSAFVYWSLTDDVRVLFPLQHGVEGKCISCVGVYSRS